MSIVTILCIIIAILSVALAVTSICLIYKSKECKESKNSWYEREYR